MLEYNALNRPGRLTESVRDSAVTHIDQFDASTSPGVLPEYTRTVEYLLVGVSSFILVCGTSQGVIESLERGRGSMIL